MPDEFDRLLDEALSVYVVTPDRPGLDQRVLARVRRHRPHGRLRFVFAPAAAAGITVLIVIALPRISQNHTPAPHIYTVIAKETPLGNTQPVLVSAPSPSRRSIRARHAEPKRPQFPTPFLLTAQERALIEIGRSQPALWAALNRPLEPVRVPLIQIELLDKRKD
jgi:hypothetical protein